MSVEESTETPKGTRGAKRAKKAGSKEGAKPHGKKAAPEGPIELRWELAELPSAQHRAGLAGLVMMVRWLARAPERKGLCELVGLTASGVTLRVDRAGMQSLFDVTYAASEEEMPFGQKLKKGKGDDAQVIEPIRTEETQEVNPKTGKTVTKKQFIYPVTVPAGAFLLECDPTRSGKNGRWIKLWRDFLWSVLRGVPATRAPFEARAERESVSDGEAAYEALANPATASVELASTYYLGAQAQTADAVPFRDRARHQFLLHFWLYAAAVYQPVVIDPRENKRAMDGYVVAVPDVAQLEAFVDVFDDLLKARGTKVAGFRPEEALVEVATEGGWDFSWRLRELLKKKLVSAAGDATLGYEVLHVNKEGNNVRVYSAAHVVPVPSMIDEYKRVRDACHDGVFKRQRLLNLFAGRPWHAGFDRLFATLPHKYVLGAASWFAKDARWSFEDEAQNAQKEAGEVTENEEAQEAPGIEQIVLRLVRNYVARRVNQKTSLDYKAVREKNAPHEVAKYNETAEKVARDAFLAVRSRTGADFREYFAGTLCSVPQFLSAERYELLTRELRNNGDEVRTLTMLALSATPTIFVPKKDSKEG